MYREVRPENLSSAIDSIWMSDSDINPADGHLAPPCVTSDLIFKIYQSNFEVILSGPITTQKSFPWVKGARYFGVRFKAGVGNLFHEASLQELVDGSADILKFAGDDLSELAEQLACQCNWDDQFHLLAHSFLNLNFSPQRNHNVEHAKDLVHQANGNLRIQALASQIGVSKRHLERLFLAFTGLSPKQYSRIVRLNHFISAVSNAQNQSMAKIALDCGYADQSHLIQEFQSMMGQTPSSYLIRYLAYK